jgi:N,N-dimethylformamidase
MPDELTATEIYGYCAELDAAPGEAVHVMVTTGADEVTVDLVRPAARGDRERITHTYEVVPGVPEQRVPGRVQRTIGGSCGVVEGFTLPAGAPGVTLELYVFPTRLGLDAPVQGLMHLDGGEDGELSLRALPGGWLEVVQHRAGREVSVRAPRPMAENQWYYAALTFDAVSGVLGVYHEPIGSPVPGDVAAAAEGAGIAGELTAGAVTGGTLLLAAARQVATPSGVRGGDCFNGKLQDPAVLVRGLSISDLASRAARDAEVSDEVARWDLGHEPAGTTFRDLGPGAFHGRFVNAPMRAVTGLGWSGDELDFRHAPAAYRAVHFHDDDLEDAGWECDAVIALPSTLPSGMYCVRLRCAGGEDHVPVFVRPAAGQARNAVAFLAPTFTYVAYANNRLPEVVDYEGAGLTERTVRLGFRDEQARAHPEFGLSTYDSHTDGSGVCYSSHLRPIPNMRWDFRSPIVGGPRHFAADLLLTTWLESLGVGYDVLSDHGLHERGAAELDGYRVLITGTHPEYWSGPMLDALRSYQDAGGSVMYLGANGFYWVTAATTERPHLLEVRRGQAGLRSWTSRPGEEHLGQSGEPGGLWRHRGRAPNRLVGVGMTSQGWDNRTPGFVRTADADDSRAKFIFDGIGDDEIVGDFGLIMGGASGDELDRADLGLGTPRHALVVATSLPHSRYYLLAIEDLQMTTSTAGGDVNPLVRSDVTFFETRAGGAVFSVGAISWAGSLAYDGYANNVARMTENVLRNFLRRGPANVHKGH